MTRLLISVVLIFVSLALGYWYRVRAQGSHLIPLTQTPALVALRDRLQFVAFFLFIPLSSLLSLWGMPTPDERLLLFPLLGITAWTLGGMAALLLAHVFRFSRPQIGSLFCCGTFSNIGAVGTLVCVLFFGEQSIAYVALYRLCEEMIYYGVAIPIAARYRGNEACKVTVQGFRISRLLLCVLAALALGVLLNKLSIPRPEIASSVASFLSISAAVLALFSIGLGLRLSQLWHYMAGCSIVLGIKFLLVPLAIGFLALAFGYGSIDNGFPLRVAIVLASMPVAMNALLPPALLSLDLDLANACWIVSTLALLFVLPLLSFVILPLL